MKSPYSNYKRYYTLDNFYKEKFGEKVFKVSLNAGFTCPNIDGSKGTGGCIYCSPSGSGDFAGNVEDDLIKQFNMVKNILHKKWPKASYIGYFQAHTNTYAPVKVLKNYYETILNQEHVIGLSIATRPDAISEECLNYLEDLSKRTFLTVELGLQSIHEVTSKLINRGHDLKCFDDCVQKLRNRNINVVVHIINGLPNESKEMMIDTIKHLNRLDIQGLKIHMLHILKNTKLAKLYEENPFSVLSKQQYVEIVVDQLELLKPDIVIHRITGDPNQEDLIEPNWLTKKFTVLNEIDKELEKRKTYQGFKLSINNGIKRILSLALRKGDFVYSELPEFNSFIEKITTNRVNSLNDDLKGKLSVILVAEKEPNLEYLHPKGTWIGVTNQDLNIVGLTKFEDQNLIEIRK